MSLSADTAGYIFAEVLRNGRYLVLTVDADGRLRRSDCPGCAWDLEDLEVGRPLPDTLAAVIAAVQDCDGPRRFPYVYLDESTVVDIHVLPDEGGRCLVLHDVGATHKAELKLQQKAHEISLLLEQQARLNRDLEVSRGEAERASRAKSRFIASMSHEFRTPINSIMGHTEILAGEHPQSEAPAAIQRASWYLLTLIENLLEQARQGEGIVQLNPTKVDVAAMLGDIYELFSRQAAARQLQFRVEACPDAAVLETDELRLRQVLINLVGNAVRYTREGAVTLSCAASAVSLEFKVTDTGPGIDAQDRERVFLPFERLDPERGTGAGLGLAISRQLVRAMGGQLELESEVGQGSTFRFSLPLGSRADSTAQRAHLAGARALLVDDDPDLLAMFRIMMTDWQLEVRTAAGLEQARKLIGDKTLDLVITDHCLNDGNGLDLIRILRESRSDARCVLTSGSASADLRAAALASGADAFLSKPVAPEQLHAVLVEVLGKGG